MTRLASMDFHLLHNNITSISGGRRPAAKHELKVGASIIICLCYILHVSCVSREATRGPTFRPLGSLMRCFGTFSVRPATRTRRP